MTFLIVFGGPFLILIFLVTFFVLDCGISVCTKDMLICQLIPGILRIEKNNMIMDKKKDSAGKLAKSKA